MLDNIDRFFGTQFASGWTTFRVDEQGFVLCDDGMNLGHLEECLEEGKTLLDLVALIETIEL